MWDKYQTVQERARMQWPLQVKARDCCTSNHFGAVLFGGFADRWSSPSEIPQSFRLCGKEYICCGALLNDPDNTHFRALAKIEGKFAMYDGMVSGTNIIKWLAEDCSFGQNFSVGKVWYVQRNSPGSTEVQEWSHDVKIGIPDGISVRSTMRSHTRHEHVCQDCNSNQPHGVPLITLKEETGNGTKNVSYYHIGKCCINGKIKSKAVDVRAAIETSDFPKEGQEMLQEKFDSLLDNVGTDSTDEDDGGNNRIINGIDTIAEAEEDKKDDDSSSESSGSINSDKLSGSSSMTSSNADKRYSLRVGDKIRSRTYFPALNNGNEFVEGIVTEIVSVGTFGYPAVRTDGGVACTLDYEDCPHFQLIQSDHNDAPPKGKGTSLQKVNLVEGKLDEIALKETRKRLADETIQKTPGGVEMQALVASLGSAKKQKLPPRHSHTTRSVAKKEGIKMQGFFENEKK